MKVVEVQTYPAAMEVTNRGDIAILEMFSLLEDDDDLDILYCHVMCPTDELAERLTPLINGKRFEVTTSHPHLILVDNISAIEVIAQLRSQEDIEDD